MDTLTEEQMKIFLEFKDNVRDEQRPDDSDFYLLRWLIARDFNVEKAEKMFRSSMEWRRQYEIDNIDKWEEPEVIQRYFAGGQVGYDKEGCPVFIEKPASIDFKGLMRSAKTSDIIKRQALTLERMRKLLPIQSQKKGKPVTQFFFIFDIEPLGRKHLNKDFLDLCRALMNVAEDNYPEFAKKMIIVNAPKIFSAVYEMMKPLVPESTKKKISIYSHNWKDVVLKYIDADQLPVYYGGTQMGPDDDIHCIHKVQQGGHIPHEYYLKGSNKYHSKHATKTTVGGTKQIVLEVSDPGSTIIWSFESEYDLAFGLYLKTSESSKKLSDMKQLVNTLKVNSHLVPEDGYYICESPGKYVFLMDNTHNRIHRNDVEYSLEVVSPHDDDPKIDGLYITESNGESNGK